MLLIPAIDLLDGRCVRLYKGRKEGVMEFDFDPLELVRSWFEEGIRRIHVVDLNGAFDGVPKNMGIVEGIIKNFPIKIQFGGGIRGMKELNRAFSSGATWAIIGTAAVEDRDFLRESIRSFGDRIIVSVDSSMGRVATKGWVDITSFSPKELAKELLEDGVRSFIFTATERDGTFEGPDVESISDFLEALEGMAEVVVAGGISSIDHIISLIPLEALGLKGVIVGRAILEGRLKIGEALEVIRNCSRKG